MNPRRAFTLIEMLIAIALTLALVGSMFGFLWDTLATRARMQEHTARRRAASTVIDRLERDLATVVASDAREGAGLKGTESSVRLLVRSVPARLADSAGPEATLGDLEQVEYRFDGGRLALRRAAVGADEPDQAFPLEGGVRHVRFRYYDGDSWQSTYDSAGRGLPLAVEIALWYEWAPDAPDAGEVEDPGAADEDLMFGAERAPREGGFDPFASDGDIPSDEFPPLPDRMRVVPIPDAQEAAE